MLENAPKHHPPPGHRVCSVADVRVRTPLAAAPRTPGRCATNGPDFLPPVRRPSAGAALPQCDQEHPPARGAAHDPGGSSRLPPELWGLAPASGGGLSLEGCGPGGAARGATARRCTWCTSRRCTATRAAFLAVPPGATGGCEVYYSYKTNPMPGVLSRAARARRRRGGHLRLRAVARAQAGRGPGAHRLQRPGEVSTRPSRGDPARHRAARREPPRGDCAVSRLAARVGRRPRVGMRITVGGAWSGAVRHAHRRGGALAAFAELARASEPGRWWGCTRTRGCRSDGRAGWGYLGRSSPSRTSCTASWGIELEVLDLGGSLTARRRWRTSRAQDWRST